MSESIKVFELAKEFNIKALDLIEKVRPLDLKLKNHMSELSAEQVEKIKIFLNPPASADAVKKKPVVRKKAKTETSDAGTAPIVLRKSAVILRNKAGEEGQTEASPEVESSTENLETSPASVSSFEDAVPSELLASPIESVETISEAEAQSPVVDEQSELALSAPTTPYEEVLASAPVSADPAIGPTVPAVAAPRRPRYSVIRVVTNEPTPRAKPLIVEEASAHALQQINKSKSMAPKTYTDPDLSRTATALLQKELAEEERKKKSSSTPRTKEEELNFKSTDYLRRERVYQPKKKRLSLGRISKVTQQTLAAAHKRVVEFDTSISVEELADALSVKAFEVVKKLRALGVDQPEDVDTLADWILDVETVQLLVSEFGYEVRDTTFNEESFIGQQVQSEEEENQDPRPPVITIMGHVDHGKTSLLDAIRRARVVSGEAGGITQHIGAYTVKLSEAIKNLKAQQEGAGEKKTAKGAKAAPKPAAKEGKSSKAGPKNADAILTFLDTPGHAAFTAMRSRGAKATDIVVLVVAASEGMMPQTREAIDHAKAAGVPIIVAMNKMDLPDANPDRIRQQLSEVGLISEEWGGETIFVPVSAKTGLGLDKLLEMIELQAELLELKARKDGFAEGVVIEAKLDKGRGSLATVLVRAGTLKVGQYIVAGSASGKIRALINDRNEQIKEAGPSTPVEILGLDSVPEAGDSVNALPDEKASKELVDFRKNQKKTETKGMSVEELIVRMSEGSIKELPIILKSDVKGSGEAIQAALMKYPSDKVRLKILSSAVGGISESDVLLASASKALIFGFNVRADAKSQNEADRRGVQIKTYSIIYELLDEAKALMEGLLTPNSKETVMGKAEVRNVFTISKVGTVAGSMVLSGKIQRSNFVRLIRDNRVIYTGKLSGLKRFKDDAKEVAEGFECGLSIEGYNDVKVGDIFEAYMVETTAAKLSDSPSAQA